MPGILITEYHAQVFLVRIQVKICRNYYEIKIVMLVLVGDFDYIKNRLVKDSTMVTAETFNPYYSDLFDQLNTRSNKTFVL